MRRLINNIGTGLSVTVGNATVGYNSVQIAAALTDLPPVNTATLMDVKFPIVEIADDELTGEIEALIQNSILSITSDIDPPTVVSDLTATTTRPNDVRLTWTNPLDQDLLAVFLLRKADAAVPADFTNDASVHLIHTVWNARPGAIEVYDDNHVEVGTTYHYALVSVDTGGMYQLTLTGSNSAAGLIDAHPVLVSDLVASSVVYTPIVGPVEGPPMGTIPGGGIPIITESHILLAWTNPSDVDLQQVIVRKKSSGYPEDHTDGELVFQDITPIAGTPNWVQDMDVNNAVDYYYAVFTADSNGSWNDNIVTDQNAVIGNLFDPPGIVQDLIAAYNPISGRFDITFTIPLNTFKFIIIRTGYGQASDITDGFPIIVEYIEIGTPIIPGAIYTAIDDSAAPGESVGYTVFTLNEAAQYSLTVTEGKNYFRV